MNLKWLGLVWFVDKNKKRGVELILWKIISQLIIFDKSILKINGTFINQLKRVIVIYAIHIWSKSQVLNGKYGQPIYNTIIYRSKTSPKTKIHS